MRFVGAKGKCRWIWPSSGGCLDLKWAVTYSPIRLAEDSNESNSDTPQFRYKCPHGGVDQYAAPCFIGAVARSKSRSYEIPHQCRTNLDAVLRVHNLTVYFSLRDWDESLSIGKRAIDGDD